MNAAEYHVSFLADVSEQLRTLLIEAEQAGQFELAATASCWIRDELRRSPLEFGESRDDYPPAGLQLRIAFARPLCVRYGVHEAAKIVYVQSFTWVE